MNLLPDIKLGVHVIWRKTTNLIGTVDSVNGYDPTATDTVGPIWLPFSFTDPGRDGTFGTADDQRLTAYGLRADRPNPVWKMVNIPEAERKYWAMIFTFDKGFSHRWQLKGSVLYSSYQGTAAAGSLGADGQTPLYDSPNVLTNANGPLYFDRPWQVRIMGTYLLPWNISLAAYYQYSSGVAWQRTLARVYFPSNYMGFGVKSPGYATLNAEPAGSERGPAFSNLNHPRRKSIPRRDGGAILPLYGRLQRHRRQREKPLRRFGRTALSTISIPIKPKPPSSSTRTTARSRACSASERSCSAPATTSDLFLRRATRLWYSTAR